MTVHVSGHVSPSVSRDMHCFGVSSGHVIQKYKSYYQLYYKNKTFVYMLPLAGLTAGPNELIFFVGTHGWRGGGIG